MIHVCASAERLKISVRVAVVACACLLLQSCNLFDLLDSPSGEAQILSAARACFDRQDYECAREYYGKLSGNGYAIAELAYLKLDQQGSGVGPMMRAFSIETGQPAGTILTILTEYSATTGLSPGNAKRDEIISAYNAVNQISATALRGFVRFTTTLALIAEILAEDGGAMDGVLSQTDITLSSACDWSNWILDPNCNSPATATIVPDFTFVDCTPYFNSGADATMPGSPDWGKFACTVSQLSTAMTELGISDGKTYSFVSQLLSGMTTCGAMGNRCSRAFLMDNLGVGRP